MGVDMEELDMGKEGLEEEDMQGLKRTFLFLSLSLSFFLSCASLAFSTNPGQLELIDCRGILV